MLNWCPSSHAQVASSLQVCTCRCQPCHGWLPGGAPVQHAASSCPAPAAAAAAGLTGKVPTFYLYRPAGASPVVDVGLEQYTASLQQVAVLRLLQQLSQVYSVMRVDSLEALVPFMGFSDVEQLIVDAVKHDFLQVGSLFGEPWPGRVLVSCVPTSAGSAVLVLRPSSLVKFEGLLCLMLTCASQFQHCHLPVPCRSALTTRTGQCTLGRPSWSLSSCRTT